MSKVTESPKVAETKFTPAQLRDYSQAVFVVSQMVFDGAFYGAQGEFTKTEAKDRIEAWLKKEVK